MSEFTDDYKAQAQAAQQLRVTNTEQLLAELKDSIDLMLQVVTDLQTLIDTPNQTIAQTPAPFIKELAKTMKAAARQAIRVTRIMVNQVDSTYVGNGNPLA